MIPIPTSHQCEPFWLFVMPHFCIFPGSPFHMGGPGSSSFSKYSRGTSYRAAKVFKFSVDGFEAPASHLETACRETPNCSARLNWDSLNKPSSSHAATSISHRRTVDYKANASKPRPYVRLLTIGRQNPQQYEITGGLEPGDYVVTTGYDTFGEAEELILK